jgi:hypothetical protein
MARLVTRVRFLITRSRLRLQPVLRVPRVQRVLSVFLVQGWPLVQDRRLEPETALAYRPPPCLHMRRARG